MTVKIAPGTFWSNEGVHLEYSGGNSPVLSAPMTAASWTVIVLNESAAVEVVVGASAASPVLPAIPLNTLPVAAIFLNSSATVITRDSVFDIRPLWEVRSETVANLQTELTNRYTIAQTDSLLVSKADGVGTNEETWTINKDLVGVPATDVFVEIERGSSSNVSLRWNETLDQWEFTNDGVAFTAIAPLEDPTFTGVPSLPTYTVGALPTVGSGGGMIYVSDATGASLTGSMCFSNGAVWIDVTTHIAVA